MTKIRSRPPLPSEAAIDSGRWMKLCKLISLPDQARRELEDAIARYRTNENTYLPAAAVRASLLRLARTASRLATLIDGLGDREHYELIEASEGHSVLGNCFQFLASARSQTALLGTWSAAAAAQATEKPGSNPIWLACEEPGRNRVAAYRPKDQTIREMGTLGARNLSIRGSEYQTGICRRGFKGHHQRTR